jgi:hypothetical protein
MNLSALPELLLSWVKTQGTALLQGNKPEQASPFKVGAEYEGKVLDLLPTGRHLVQVAGQKMDMGLPRHAQTGDTVRLTFLNAGPRPTFLLNGQGPVTPVQQVQISHTAQQVNALMRLAQPAAQPAIQAPSLVAGSVSGQAPVPAALQAAGSQTAPQAAGQVAAQAPGPAVVQSAARVAVASLPLPTTAATPQAPGTPPLTASPSPPQAGPAATTVRINAGTQAVQALAAQPGPNVAQLAATARPIVANVVMLQGYSAATPAAPTAVASANTALLGQAVDGLRAALPGSTTLRPTVLADPASPSANLLPSRLNQTLRESGLFYEAHLARWTKGAYPFESVLNEPQARLARAAVPMPGMAELGGMPEEAARLAGRQLHMLEGGPFLWQGYAWSGQWMDWLVEERQEGQGDGQGGDEPNPWATELRLILPHMGAVNAQLSLRGQEVHLRLRAAEASTAQAMSGALPALQQGLETAGLRPVSLLVEGEGA